MIAIPGRRERLRAHRPSLSRHALILVVLVVAGMGLAVFTAQVSPRLLDQPLLMDMQEPRDDLSGVAWFFNDFLNNYGIGAAWAATIGVFLVLRRWDGAAFFALSLLINPYTWALKELVDRPRPQGPFTIPEITSGSSFPSAHTTLALGFCGAWFLFAPLVLPRNLVLPVRVAGIAIVLTAGFFRVWAGAHWPTDVLAAIVLGSAFMLALWIAMHWVGAMRHHQPAGATPLPAGQ